MEGHQDNQIWNPQKILHDKFHFCCGVMGCDMSRESKNMKSFNFEVREEGKPR